MYTPLQYVLLEFSFGSIAACWQVEKGVMTIVGARSSTATKAISLVSTALHIPQITPTATNPQLGMILLHMLITPFMKN